MDIDETVREVTKKTARYKEPVWEHSLTYDSPMETLEPVYFWILDFMEGSGVKVKKISDNFTASPGSGYFGDLATRAANMQDRGMTILKLLGSRDGMIANVMSLINDLKMREMKLKDYEDARSPDKIMSEAGWLALKRRWVDEVDVRKGRGSLLNMNQQAFPGILDAFHKANSLNDIKGLDVNDQIRRMLEPRVKEFLDWKKKSEEAERKYYQIEKGHLRNQLNSIKLYAKWVKPYLVAAERLTMKESKSASAALVTAFDTVILELCLFGKKEIDIKKEVIAKDIPSRFSKVKMRKYYSCVFIELSFRGIPTKRTPNAGARYAFGGKVDVKFRAYALNEEEIALLESKIDEEDLSYVFGIVKGITETGLATLQDDIDYFLKKEESDIKKAEQAAREAAREINPFAALASAFFEIFTPLKKEKKPEEKEEKSKEESEKEKLVKIKEEGIKKDSFEERVARKLAEGQAKSMCFNVYDKYKKAHDMASFHNPFE